MTREEIARLLRETGLKPQTAAGQHFLLDESVIVAMIDAADVQPGETVLEIGPGFGILTAALLEAGANVIAVELDQRLFAYLGHRFRRHPKLTLIKEDIFRLRLADYVQDQKYKLIANLPYSATNLVFRNFLTLPPRPVAMTVMIQKEVADRITAEPGQMSMLSLMAQYYGSVVEILTVPKTSFYPSPAVVSAVIHLNITRPIRPEHDEHLFRTAKAGFSSRRKQLHNSLAAGLHQTAAQVTTALEGLGIDSSRRAQDLSVAEWKKIARLFV